MELRHLRYFVAIAEHGSISRAARAIYIAQPALTKQLHDLERELGTTLVERRSRGIELTPGGRQFLADAREILTASTLAKERALRAGTGQMGSLSIGITVLHALLPVFLRIMHTFRSSQPEVSISLRQLLSAPQIEDIRAEKLDAGILFFRPANDAALEGTVIHEEPLVLAVPRDSFWAGHPPAQLNDLASADFIWFPRSASPDYHDQLIYCFHKAGFTPKVTQEGADNRALLSLVAAGLGCTILPAAAQVNAPDSVVFMPVADLDFQLPLELVWRTDNHSPVLRRFVRDAQACAARR